MPNKFFVDMSCGGGKVVNDLSIYSDNMNLNSDGYLFFYCLQKRRRKGSAEVGTLGEKKINTLTALMTNRHLVK